LTAFQRAWRGGRNDWRLHALSVFSIAVAFVCLAAALLVVVNVEGVRTRWASSGRASVYLKPGAEEAEINKLHTALQATRGIRAVTLVSAEDARKELVDRGDPDGVLALLPIEAFPASLELDLEAAVGQDRVEAIVARLGAIPTVEAVETYSDWTERLGSALKGGVAAAGLLALVVLAAVVSVVASTMRLSLQRRSTEVQVMKLVGATDRYVRRPFIVEGAAQGALGAFFAIALLGALYGIIVSQLDGQLAMILGITPQFLPWTMMISLVAAGAVLGALTAMGSIRRLLAV
jgi:cell division transport system permease protein